MTELDRRRFFAVIVGSCAAFALSGCASVMAMRVPASGGRARLLLGDYPQLTQPGGHLVLLPDGVTAPIYLFHLEEGRFLAISSVCTHLGCIVELEGEQLVCPCHGSTFERSGAVVRGPAEVPLREFATRLSGSGELIVDLEFSA
jgi:Rieske Fe-S protein